MSYEHLALVKRYSDKVNAYGVDYILGEEKPHFTQEDRDLRNLDLDGAEVNDLNLSFADMTGRKWLGGKLIRCKFIRTNLTKVDFGPEQAEKTIFQNCKLVLVSLADSFWKQVLMTKCFMECVDFSLVSLVSNEVGLTMKQYYVGSSITRLPKVLQDMILVLMLGKKEEIKTPDAIQDFFNPDLPYPDKIFGMIYVVSVPMSFHQMLILLR